MTGITLFRRNCAVRAKAPNVHNNISHLIHCKATHKAVLLTLFAVVLAQNAWANQREYLWPKGKMPDTQSAQIAAMTDVSGSKDFVADKWRRPYLEWFDAPAKEKRIPACMILISGGGYSSTCDVGLIKLWHETFTNLGIQCVSLVYRTPRPAGLPYYKSGWEDAQRAVKLVRSEAKKRGYDPECIGIISMSAGSHIGLMLATSSETPAYKPVDKIDTTSCHVNWAILNAPAYITTDGSKGTPATRQGYAPDVRLDTIFHFDRHTCPISLHHGGNDIYSPNGSTLVYRQLRRMHIPAELHLYPDKPHGAFGLDRAVEFMRQMGYLGTLEKEVSIMSRFPNDDARGNYKKEALWPEGKMPDRQDKQCEPYIEWHFPKTLKTKAIQIIYSGGSYTNNDTDGMEVAPARRYLNQHGMTVVTMKYRTPRPAAESGLNKHTTAWEDLQRAIRTVRSEAAKYGLDPNRIGIMGSSAGGHLTLMGVTSSQHQSYWPIDEIDKQPCNVQWGIAIYPAYVLSDGAMHENSEGGNEDRDVINPEFSFDLKTAPTLFVHGDADGWAAMNSVKTWERMRAMGVQSELHTLAMRKHCFQNFASPGTGSYTYLDRIWEFLTEKGFNK